MLTHLSVRNFAVVEGAELDFGPGLTVVTGETGAGKSLLVDALLLLSGARADAGMVRAGCERAEISADSISPMHRRHGHGSRIRRWTTKTRAAGCVA